MHDEDMKLPEGKTCADCGAFKRCALLFGGEPDNTECDFSPSRFAPRMIQVPA